MEQYDRIRPLVNVEGKSIREAGESLGHVRKTLVHASQPGYRRQVPAPRPAIDPVKPIIEAWLEEDRQRPRKQRHTGQRIFERLRDEYEFTSSASAIPFGLGSPHFIL